MENVKRLLPQLTTERQLIGTLTGVDDNNRPLVEFADNPINQPIPAMSLIAFPASAKAWLSFPIPVLINLIGDDLQPVIVGLLHEQLFTSPGHDQAPSHRSAEYSHHQLNADFINIEGHDEIQFNCGKSSLSLKKNGQIIIKGDNITNRARGSNKIRGGSVKIN